MAHLLCIRIMHAELLKGVGIDNMFEYVCLHSETYKEGIWW